MKAYGQISLTIENPKKVTIQKELLKKGSLNKKAINERIKKIYFALYDQGYLLAQIDTIHSDSSTLTLSIQPSEQYKWIALKKGNLNPTLASKIGFREKDFTAKPLNKAKLGRLFENIIIYYENHGHPFVSVSLDSLIMDKDKLSATLNVNPGTLFKIDSVKIIGNLKVNEKFLSRYIGIIPGKPFNEEAIRKVPKQIKQLPFVLQTKPQMVRLSEKTNKLILFLDKKNASQFDGIVGILPDATTGKAIITGDVKIKLVNGIIRNGETFDVEWRRLRSQTQDFKGILIYPYLFGSPFGADYGLKIYRRDTTFIDINNEGGLHYYFNGLNFIKVNLKQRQLNLISTSGLENVTTLPSYADITTTQNGVGIFLEDLDYRFNPRKGISIEINGSFGNKHIRKNPHINDAVYQDLPLNSIQYQYDANIKTFIPLKGASVLHFGLKSASVFGNGPIFRNELIRIGGLKTLRGFDEESIFTSFYVIPTIEYRLLFSENSHLLLFAEGAFYENNSYHYYINDTPMSFGAGINFETKAGILSINYGVGNQLHNGFDARNGKIHVGLTALF